MLQEIFVGPESHSRPLTTKLLISHLQFFLWARVCARSKKWALFIIDFVCLHFFFVYAIRGELGCSVDSARGQFTLTKLSNPLKAQKDNRDRSSCPWWRCCARGQSICTARSTSKFVHDFCDKICGSFILQYHVADTTK